MEEEKPVFEDFNKTHYEAQMESVKRILRYKEQDMDIETAARKIGLAPSYVSMVYEKGEKNMDKYWRRLHNVKTM